MKPSLALIVLALVSWPACAQTRKPCEELKSEIEKKLEAKGVSSFSLEIVAKEEDTDAKVVGTCDGGTKKIVYKRTPAAAAKAQPAATGKP